MGWLKYVGAVFLLCLCLGTSVGAFGAEAGAGTPQPPAPTVQQSTPPDPDQPRASQDRGLFAGIVVTAIFAATAFSLLTIRRSLLNSTWSLADALSEDVELTPVPPAGGAGGAAPAPVRRLVASTSRFIAMLGLVAILMMFIGFGLVVLYDFALTGKPPKKDAIVSLIYFLTSGLTLFAPYAVNKVAAAVS